MDRGSHHVTAVVPLSDNAIGFVLAIGVAYDLRPAFGRLVASQVCEYVALADVLREARHHDALLACTRVLVS